ncbi:MAG: GDSL-type esterase/lipase family protein [Candidatus Methylacidiphilales bacterium]
MHTNSLRRLLRQFGFHIMSCLALLMMAALTSSHAATVYESDFATDIGGWKGRAGYGKESPSVKLGKDPKDPNSLSHVISITTDQALGTGFRFAPPVKLVPGKDYELTFWVRSTAGINVGARISTEDFTGYGEDVKGWFNILNFKQTDEWIEVRRFFSPLAETIGIEIGVGEAEPEIAELSIKDVKITNSDPVTATPASVTAPSPVDPVKPVVSTTYARWLAIGDSITQHGAKADLKWEGETRGMAASSLDKDYVHLLQAMLKKKNPNYASEIKIVGRLGKLSAGTIEQMTTVLAELKTWNPDLVTIQLGENDSLKELGEDGFESRYRTVVDAFVSGSGGKRPVILCTGVWSPGAPAPGADTRRYPAASATAIKERIIEKICQEKGLLFVSIAPIAMKSGNAGTGQTPGVKWHPNDAGMQDYADAIYKRLFP